MPERPLEGKVAVITGASRGIGKAIALKLAEAGCDIVGNSVDPSKQKRVNSVMEEIRKKGSHVSWSIGDITTEEGRENLWREAYIFSDEVNYLFLNAAGGLETDKPDGWPEVINIDAPLALVKTFTDEFSTIMKPGSKIIYLTSLWAEKFGKVKQPPFYRFVAKTKFLAERRLREMIPDLGQQGIDLGFLCGHIVSGTSAHTLMSRAFPQYIEGIEKTAKGNKFPTALDMADGALNLLLSDFKSGHTEYVGGRNVEPIDPRMVNSYVLEKKEVRAKLPMYGDSKLLVDRFLSPQEDELGYAKETGKAEYRVREIDTMGHFSGNFKDINLFRGVDQIEAAAQAAGMVILGLEPDLAELKFVPVFKGVGTAKFLETVSTGELLKIDVKLTNMNPQAIRGNAEIKIGDKTVSSFEGLEFGFIHIDALRRIISRQKAARLTKGES